MATSRSWRQHSIDGPYRAQTDEIDELNQIFSDSFTERYRRDGMVGVRVPFLNSYLIMKCFMGRSLVLSGII